ncbi:coiled-coil domain-containing protein 82 isoform X2 [Rhinoderma darwinii]|uniref:coiled-coil domain-containing protein 82 isoform X2 n=1 Tax=Rhinoderma darwinii TaxID=43563 RepID=UPI003F67072C
METTSKNYNTRQKRKLVEPTLKSRVDWKRTKKDTISYILDSVESLTSEEEESEETDEESDDSSCTGESEDQSEETTIPEEDGEEERIKKPRLKKSAMIGSDSSSDSDGPGEKVTVKRSCVIKEDDSDEADDKKTKAHIKKQKRLETLKRLAERQRSRSRSISHEATEESPHDAYAPLTPETLCQSEEDSSNLSDFIVQDEEENNDGNPTSSYQELFKKHHISLSACHDLSSHLHKVIKAFLINIIDKKFLTTLYEGVRKKRYAKDMLNSLNYLDDRIIRPRLERLTTSCRWTKKYEERINCYPHLHVQDIPTKKTLCKACNLKRVCRYRMTLSGQAYDNKTLEDDDFLHDDKQVLVIGNVCASRTEVYHQLRHYKYFLYQRCIPFIDENKEDAVNEIVESALSEMEAKDFLENVSFFKWK